MWRCIVTIKLPFFSLSFFLFLFIYPFSSFFLLSWFVFSCSTHLQIVETDDGSYHLWTRWGRVGEPGANQHQQFSSVDDAVKAFKKKFHDKTRNKFEERHKFVAHPGKYTIIEIEGEDEEQPCASTKVVCHFNHFNRICKSHEGKRHRRKTCDVQKAKAL